VVPNAVRRLLDEPRPGKIPPRKWWDYAIVGLLLVMVAVEAAVARVVDDEHIVHWPPVTLSVAAVVSVAVLFRRQHPFESAMVAFAAHAVLDLVLWLARDTTSAAAAAVTAGPILIYALWRWAPGHQVAIASVGIFPYLILSDLATNPGNGVLVAVGTLVPWSLFAALGIAVRYRARLHERELESTRTGERHQLARELHDSVAHHMSAIAIQAQAGRAVAAQNPDAALEVLATIEEQASQSLTEMRRMVGALRSTDADGDAELAPGRTLNDIVELANTGRSHPRVEVELDGDLAELGPSVEASLFRLAQEAITNARRHARHATRIRVHICGAAESVRLTVSDDGDRASAPSPQSAGYGLVGMAERIEILGGEFSAAPGSTRGWVVDAVLPRVANP
jgi:signal transduction histidine kinase